jgi:hypothetical protein
MMTGSAARALSFDILVAALVVAAIFFGVPLL